MPAPSIPKALFSRDLERQARAQAWSQTWKHRKSMVVAYYCIDVGGALLRALMHVVLWVPAIVLWPLLLSSNGVVKQSVLDWVVAAGGGGWDGALWKLTAAVFVCSMTTQLLRGAVGERLRAHLDRHMERSLLWNLFESQVPLAPTHEPPSSPVPSETPTPPSQPAPLP